MLTCTLMRKTPVIVLTTTLVLASAAFYFSDLLSYATAQGIGQLRIVWNARPISEVLTDPSTPDSISERLKFVGQVRKYAIDSLGLNDTKNYTTYYDQHGQEILWVVTACDPFQLKEKVWEFPIVGKVPYKGFFSPEKAKEEALIWKQNGLDVSVRNPGGWSTLGWFTDPVLSSMLTRSKGDLASLIIHEMAHATIYVKDSSTFNENLASFIGDEGARKFLIDTYGKDSPEWKDYDQEEKDYRKWTSHMLRGADVLDSLYKSSVFTSFPDSIKTKLKADLIRVIVIQADTLKTTGLQKSSRYFQKHLPNNAYFMSFIRYQAMQTDFTKTYRDQFSEDILLMIRFYQKKFPFL